MNIMIIDNLNMLILCVVLLITNSQVIAQDTSTDISPDNMVSGLTNGSPIKQKAKQENTLLSTQNAVIKTDKELNRIMTEIGNVMTVIFPIIFSEKPLTKSQNYAVYNSVTQLKTLFSRAGPYITKKSPTYQMSYQLLNDYLESIIVEDNPVSLLEIKSRLTTLSNFCVSCHTQDSEFRTIFRDTHTTQFSSDLERGEFNYATRNYDVAQSFYKRYLLSTKLSDADTLRIIFKTLSINTQIINNPKAALDFLSDLQEEGNFSQELDQFLQESTEAISSLIEQKETDEKSISFSRLSEYANNYLGNSSFGQGIIFSTTAEKIERLWFRGLLFRYLNHAPRPDQIPLILYWLALCDLSLGGDYDFNLADFYIKQCITRYSAHPFAKTCFDEYKAYVKFYYTTPTEPVLPFEINNELVKLKKHLDKK